MKIKLLQWDTPIFGVIRKTLAWHLEWGCGERDLRTTRNMEGGEALIIFVFQKCPKAFLPKESALVRLSQIVASTLNIMIAGSAVPLQMALVMIWSPVPLTLLRKSIGSNKHDPLFFTAHAKYLLMIPPPDTVILWGKHLFNPWWDEQTGQI